MTEPEVATFEAQAHFAAYSALPCHYTEAQKREITEAVTPAVLREVAAEVERRYIETTDSPAPTVKKQIARAARANALADLLSVLRPSEANSQSATSSSRVGSSRPLVTRDEVVDALDTAWGDFVGDTGCFPDCLKWHGGNGTLSADFGYGNFATFVTDWLNSHAANLRPSEAPKGSEQ